MQEFIRRKTGLRDLAGRTAKRQSGSVKGIQYLGVKIENHQDSPSGLLLYGETE